MQCCLGLIFLLLAVQRKKYLRMHVLTCSHLVLIVYILLYFEVKIIRGVKKVYEPKKYLFLENLQFCPLIAYETLSKFL